MIRMKQCAQCGRNKKLDSGYGAKKTKPDGFHNICKLCRSNNKHVPEHYLPKIGTPLASNDDLMAISKLYKKQFEELEEVDAEIEKLSEKRNKIHGQMIATDELCNAMAMKHIHGA